MKHPIKYMILTGVIVLFLPLGVTVLLSGTDAVSIQKQMDMETYLPAILCEQVPWDYEEEMLKVQAVLARSSLYYYMEKEKPEEIQWEEKLEQFQRDRKNARYREAYERMERAVRLTRGQVITWQGDVCPGIFHRISSGKTRDGMEVLQDVTFSFLRSVDSGQDREAEEFLKGHYFTPEALEQRLQEEYPGIIFTEEPLTDQIRIEKRDSQDYILEMKVGDQTVTGEEFRRKLELSSCNFTIQELDGKIRFLCKGLGHGLGLSQYGGNELAKKGKTYQEILFFYFPDLCIECIILETL
mgnify:FL=1